MPKIRQRRATDTSPRQPSAAEHAARERDRAQQALALRRMGQTRAERLRWVVSEFAAKDLDALRPEEVTALGYDLRQLLSPGWGVTRKVGPLTRRPSPDHPARSRQGAPHSDRGAAGLRTGGVDSAIRRRADACADFTRWHGAFAGVRDPVEGR